MGGRRTGHLSALLALFLLVTACFLGTSGGTAQASVSPGNAALDWAEAHALGHWYAYGTNGPVTYDCSGLVSTAILKATGIWIGRSTYEMLATGGHGHLTWIPLSQARRGDILFYGPGHVEFDTIWHDTSFGAHDWGQRIGWITWGGGWQPTEAFRLRLPRKRE